MIPRAGQPGSFSRINPPTSSASGPRPGALWHARLLPLWAAILALLALGLGALALVHTPISAQEPTATPEPAQEHLILVGTNSPFPLLVDGLPVEAGTAGLDPGSEVCVTASVGYTSGDERWIFQGWSGTALPLPSNGEGAKTPCISPTQPGRYQAIYVGEVLFHVVSPVGDIQNSTWVPSVTPGELAVPVPVELGVTELVEAGEGVRYRFEGWSEGETPLLPTNRVVPLGPKTIEVSWIKEYLVQIEGPPAVILAGSGWYEEGASLMLRAPDIIPASIEGERRKFARWESVGEPVLELPDQAPALTTITVDGPYTLRAGYDQQFFMLATDPSGILFQEWLYEGDPLTLETESIIEVVPEQVRLVFQRWDGQEGLISPRISGTVDKASTLAAVYEEQVMVTVDGPEGSTGGGWTPVGTTTTVTAPEEVPTKFLFNETFVRFSGYGLGQASVQVLAQEPTVVSALYQTKVDLLVLGLLAAVPIQLALIFFAGRWVLLWTRPPARRPEPIAVGVMQLERNPEDPHRQLPGS